MQFCPKCGTILVKKKKRFVCPKCGYVSRENLRIVSNEKLMREAKIDVVHEKDTSVWPIVSETCPKCGHNKAYYFTAQTRAGDEAETRFFKCAKCKHTWREYT